MRPRVGFCGFRGVIMIKPENRLGREAWVRIQNRVFTIGANVAGSLHSLLRRISNGKQERMREGRLSMKQALLLSLLAISGFVAPLYLAAFAGILLLAHRTGLVVIRADNLFRVTAEKSNPMGTRITLKKS